MTDRERDQRDDAPERVPAAAPAPSPDAARRRAAALTALGGNQAVARAVRVSRDATAPPTPAQAAQAAQEAEAIETIGRLRTAHQHMAHSAELRIRNTAELFDPPGSPPQGRRMRAEPMTLRSDSAQLVADRGENPAQDAYYFRGIHQDNEQKHGPTTLGTIEGNTLLVRGRGSSGTWQSEDDMIGTFVHEASHVLVADYGEHPGTKTDAGSFDRYKDEFRAYFVEPSFFPALAGNARAAQIKIQLCGTALGSGGYPDLNANYWATPATTFKTQVDAHLAPDGFNLNNSAKLDRFVGLLRELAARTSTVDDVLFQISVLSPDERTEAAGATLMTTLLGRVAAADAGRIRSALTSPAAVGFGHDLNPNDSPKVTALLSAIVGGDEEAIKQAYRDCAPADKGAVYMNPHVLAWIRYAMPSNVIMRANVIVMLNTGSVGQYDATAELQRQLYEAHGAPALPDPLRAALRAMSFTGKLSFYRFGDEAYRFAVNPLPEAFRGEVNAILRADREP
jgi:hypothetical protein